jgi:hypothetical protein
MLEKLIASLMTVDAAGAPGRTEVCRRRIVSSTPARGRRTFITHLNLVENLPAAQSSIGLAVFGMVYANHGPNRLLRILYEHIDHDLAKKIFDGGGWVADT